MFEFLGSINGIEVDYVRLDELKYRFTAKDANALVFLGYYLNESGFCIQTTEPSDSLSVELELKRVTPKAFTQQEVVNTVFDVAAKTHSKIEELNLHDGVLFAKTASSLEFSEELEFAGTIVNEIEQGLYEVLFDVRELTWQTAIQDIIGFADSLKVFIASIKADKVEVQVETVGDNVTLIQALTKAGYKIHGTAERFAVWF